MPLSYTIAALREMNHDQVETCVDCGEMLEYCVCEYLPEGFDLDAEEYADEIVGDGGCCMPYYDEDPEPHAAHEIPEHFWDSHLDD